DEMFRRDVPRVQNRRDPEFSALVQSALAPPAVSETVVSASSSAALRMLGAEVDDFEIEAAVKPTVEKPKRAGDGGGWAPQRIAIMPESTGLSDLGETSQATEFHSSDWNVPQSQGDGRSWMRRDTVPQEAAASETFAEEDEPVLIVEDDNPAKAPVRREEY